MATPTTYTNTTFADYLKDEVLIDTAVELGWLDYTTPPEIRYIDDGEDEVGQSMYIKEKGTFQLPSDYLASSNWAGEGSQRAPVVATPVSVGRLSSFDKVLSLTTTGNGTTTRTLAEVSTVAAPAGTVVGIGDTAFTWAHSEPESAGSPRINYSAGTVTYNHGFSDGIRSRVLATDLDIGDTTIEFTVALTDAIYEVGSGIYEETLDNISVVYLYHDASIAEESEEEVEETPRVINPIYQSIIDSVLMQIGGTDITQISGVDNIYKLRMYGKREVWKYAMQALAGDYSYSTDAGGSTRFQVYEHCREIYGEEDARVSVIYGETIQQAQASGQLKLSTTRTKIKVRW